MNNPGYRRRSARSYLGQWFGAQGTVTLSDLGATTNSFVAAHDGRATVRVTIQGAVTHAEGLLLIYHSDGRDHGVQRGKIGVDAHHQLIVRVP